MKKTGKLKYTIISPHTNIVRQLQGCFLTVIAPTSSEHEKNYHNSTVQETEKKSKHVASTITEQII